MVTTAARPETTTLPRWARRYLTSDGPARIGEALRQAEAATHAALVPLVVRSSTATGHVLPLLAVILLAVYFAIGLGDRLAALHGDAVVWSVVHLAVILVLAWALSQIAAVRRLLTAHHDTEAQVLRRAALEFYEAGLDRTQAGAGILIFVSIAERRAVVLADRATAARLHPETWQDVVDLLVQGVRRADLDHGMVDALAACRRHLEGHVPAHGERPLDLRDALVLKD